MKWEQPLRAVAEQSCPVSTAMEVSPVGTSRKQDFTGVLSTKTYGQIGNQSPTTGSTSPSSVCGSRVYKVSKDSYAHFSQNYDL